jgi:ABC-type glucose/galactose transport system permease subunit
MIKKLWISYRFGLILGLVFNALAVWPYPSLIQTLDYIHGINQGVYDFSNMNWWILSAIYLFIQAPLFGYLHYRAGKSKIDYKASKKD